MIALTDEQAAHVSMTIKYLSEWSDLLHTQNTELSAALLTYAGAQLAEHADGGLIPFEVENRLMSYLSSRHLEEVKAFADKWRGFTHVDSY